MEARTNVASASERSVRKGISSKNKLGLAGLGLCCANAAQAANEGGWVMNGWLVAGICFAVLASGLYLQSTRRRTG